MIFVTSLAERQSPEHVEKLIEQTKQLSTEVGGEMFTAAETWTSQVEKKGKLAKEIDMIERFLKAGAPWEMVVKATGITQEKLRQTRGDFTRNDASSNPTRTFSAAFVDEAGTRIEKQQKTRRFLTFLRVFA